MFDKTTLFEEKYEQRLRDIALQLAQNEITYLFYVAYQEDETLSVFEASNLVVKKVPIQLQILGVYQNLFEKNINMRQAPALMLMSLAQGLFEAPQDYDDLEFTGPIVDLLYDVHAEMVSDDIPHSIIMVRETRGKHTKMNISAYNNGCQSHWLASLQVMIDSGTEDLFRLVENLGRIYTL